MRILHLIPSLGDGGAERQLSYLARALACRGHAVHVGLLHGGSNSAQLSNGSVRVHELSAKGNHDPRLALEIWRLIRRVRPQIVQTWLTQMDVLGGAIAVATGIPWILSERCSEPCYPHSLKNAARRLLARRANLIVANSQGGVEYWNTMASRVRCAIVLNGLPLSEIDLAEPASTAGTPFPDRPILLHVGRLAPQKNIKALLHAFARTRNELNLVLVGCGPERDEIHGLIRRLGIEKRVVTIEHVDRVWSLMKRAAAVISVSHYEGQPNVLLEAMACRCPIIASAIASHLEILDAESALIVDKDAVSDISDAIDRVIADRGAALERAEVARTRVLNRTVERCAERYEHLYHAISSGTSPSIATTTSARSTSSVESGTADAVDATPPIGTRE